MKSLLYLLENVYGYSEFSNAVWMSLVLGGQWAIQASELFLKILQILWEKIRRTSYKNMTVNDKRRRKLLKTFTPSWLCKIIKLMCLTFFLSLFLICLSVCKGAHFFFHAFVISLWSVAQILCWVTALKRRICFQEKVSCCLYIQWKECITTSYKTTKKKRKSSYKGKI